MREITEFNHPFIRTALMSSLLLLSWTLISCLPMKTAPEEGGSRSIKNIIEEALHMNLLLGNET
jgi:hypothetical protein